MSSHNEPDANKPDAFLAFGLLLCAGLAGCALPIPQPSAAAMQPAATAWMAPLPASARAGELAAWWAAWQDPSLNALLQSAEQGNPTLLQAEARIREARAQAAAAGAALWPSVAGSASLQRSRDALMQPDTVMSTSRLGLDAAWELDLWGGVAAARQGILANLAGSESSRDDARASLAAEIANGLVTLRGAEQLRKLAREELQSRERTLNLQASRQRAGFASSVDIALLEGALADARNQETEAAANIDIAIKALVALTGQDETPLRKLLAGDRGKLPMPPSLQVDRVPAQALAQRADIRSAAASVASAAAQVTVAEVARYPALSLSGSIGTGRMSMDGVTISGDSWSFGPSLRVPLFNAGKLAADVQAADARYQQALAVYQQKVRQAVREVEEALVRVDAGNRREPHLQQAVNAYRTQYNATESRLRAGSASVLDLEETHRLLLSAQTRLAALQRERVANWIILYKALGGGWQAAPTPTGTPS